ncbi:MAG: hypothetical protein M0Z99_33160 [Betaproteobacteria bacterium]|nr:hypothetical protein [Betaproteobacteria bacterium]
MNIRLVISTAACAALFAGAAVAADGAERGQQVVGFGSGTGMGAGAGAGSASSAADGFSSQSWTSGSGSQSFGGGFDPQQTIGSGPLSSNPAAPTGSGPTLTPNPY